MRIVHEWERRRWDPEQSKYVEELYIDRKVYKNIVEVTHHRGVTWYTIYWQVNNGVCKALCFTSSFNMEESLPVIISFDTEHEMRRFQEDLRLQEKNARASANPKEVPVG